LLQAKSLKVDKIERLEKIYLENSGNNFSFLTKYDILKSEICTIIVLYDFNNYDSISSVDFFINSYLKISGQTNSLKEGLKNFLTFYENIKTDPNYIGFIELLAKLYIDNYSNSYIKLGYQLPSLPNNPIENSIFIDLASGTDFINFYDSLSSNSIYYLIDKSIFSCKVLEIKSKECNIRNIIVLNKSVEDLSMTDFNTIVGVVRAKNLFRYVGFHPEVLTFLQNIIVKGGIFTFQEHTQSQSIKNTIYSRLKNLFNSSWECLYSEGNIKNPLDLDTMTFIKK
jgi:hypothetical protein